jgi:hypothetical protein
MFPFIHLTRARHRASCALALAAVGTLAPRPAGADEVVRWNQIAMTTAGHASLDPLAQSRLLAVLHVAVHDAVNAIERRDEPYCAVSLDASGALPEAAAASAAHVILSTWLPADRPALDAALADSLAVLPEGQTRDLGVASGRQAADLVMVAWATGCGDRARAGSQDRLVEALGLLARGCDTDLMPSDLPEHERRTETRTEEWNRRARAVAASRRLDLQESARLFAIVNLALCKHA